ncbi:hypothetical protein [Geitlerinema sp. PCC 7407]|uniref:hypothetical protein n=1 Tax=Geitlerinema sp. PCC 7407 TaxID=1173025 RepID=UPI00029FC2FD|nr:hypothetical protein [Geitlerinema sp. PCC 7407]AFY64917.1 hypothetical protein GEI7407_0416 [Geitlerinema sp. PCC 7407]
MDGLPNRDELTSEFCRERSVRRTARVLQIKRDRLRDELCHMLSSMAFFTYSRDFPPGNGELSRDIVEEALARLGDDAFAQWIEELIHNRR